MNSSGILVWHMWTIALIAWILPGSDAQTAPIYTWGSPAITRSHMDTATPGGFLMIPSPPAPSLVATKLTDIEFFCHNGLSYNFQFDASVDVMILRPIQGSNKYTIVDHANVSSLFCYNRVQRHSISLDVQVGDVLGLGFNADNTIPYDYYIKQGGCVRQVHMGYVSPTLGNNLTFTTEFQSGSQCRIYSVRALYPWTSGPHPTTPQAPTPIRTTTTRRTWGFTTTYMYPPSWSEGPSYTKPTTTLNSGMTIGYVIFGVVMVVFVIGIVVCRMMCRNRAMRQGSLTQGTPMQPVMVPPPQRPHVAPGPRPYPTQTAYHTQAPGSYPAQPGPYPGQTPSPYPPNPSYPPTGPGEGVTNPSYNSHSIPPSQASPYFPYPNNADAPPPYSAVVKDPEPEENVNPSAPSFTPTESVQPTVDSEPTPQVPPPQYEDIIR